MAKASAKPHHSQSKSPLPADSACDGAAAPRDEVIYLHSRPYVSHAALLRLAQRKHCAGISVHPVMPLCNPSSRRWVFAATVFPTTRSRGFMGYGDAEPGNVSPEVQGAEMRVAETRAVNRALRKAYGIGLCSVEELGHLPVPAKPQPAKPQPAKPQPAKPEPKQQPEPAAPRLRDRLALLVRSHGLDPAAVKRYAAEFCQVRDLKQADRGRVERFVADLETGLASRREEVLRTLSRYAGEAA